MNERTTPTSDKYFTIHSQGLCFITSKSDAIIATPEDLYNIKYNEEKEFMLKSIPVKVKRIRAKGFEITVTIMKKNQHFTLCYFDVYYL